MTDPPDHLRAILAPRYRLERELGHGGMATVYLAEDLKHHRPVAIKVLEPDLGAVLGPERFLREIEIAARLQHPHILPLLDSGADGLVFYYVMPYVEGESLRARIDSERQLRQDEAVRLTVEVAGALDYAHRQGIVHRDVKPENVLLADGHAMVADFGIARAIQASGGEKLTRSGVTLGSPPYMSPEQIAGRADVDGRSDLYSLGCLLYEMLAGQPPFTGPPETLVHQHMNLTPRPIRELRPSISPELSAVVARALAKTPADRFATGAALAAALTSNAATGATTADAPTTATAGAAAAEPRGPASPTPIFEASPAPAPRRPMRMARAALTFTAIALAALAFVIWRSGVLERKIGPASAANRRWVWLADFEGPAGDASLAPAAHDLVAAALDQSKLLASVPSEQVKIALRNSGRPDSSRIDGDLARQLALRSSIPVVVEGKIGRIGASYSVVLKATSAEDGHVIESASDAAPTESDLVAVLTKLARDLRRALGERSELFQTTASWSDAPTPSFEAFKFYLRGRKLIERSDDWAALSLLRQAVSIDPDFATAWAAIGTAQGNLGRFDSALAGQKEALRHPDWLSPTRRLDIQGKIALYTGNWDAGIQAYDAILNLNPSPVERFVALNNKAILLTMRGQSETALRLFREAAAVEPVEPSPLVVGNIVDQLIALRRDAEVRAMLATTHLPGLGHYATELALIDRAWGRAESLSVATQNDPSTGPLDWHIAESVLASVRAARGEYDEGIRILDRDLEVGIAQKDLRVVGRRVLLRDQIARLLGRRVPEMPALLRGWSGGIAVLACRAAAAGDSAAARRTVAQWSDSIDGSSRDAVADHVEGLVDARFGRWDRVVGRLAPGARRGIRAVPNIDRSLRSESRWLVADAFEKLGRPDSAVVYLDLILDPPAREPPQIQTVGWWEPFVRCRLVRLYARMGKLQDAERQWETVSATCTHPDPQIAAMLDETRAVLQSTRGMATGANR